jgi:signal transduction histidine kinase
MSTREASTARDDRRLRVLGVALFVAMVLGVALRAFLNVANGGVRSDLETGTAFDVILLVFPAVGVALVTKRPRNVLGWLMMGIGLVFISTPGAPYARYASVTRAGELPGAGLALAIEAPSWVAFVGLSGFLLLLFPDGHLPSRRWRWFARACGVGLAILFVVTLVSPDHGEDYGLPVENPVAIEAFGPALDALVPLALVAPLTVIGGAVAVFGRLRRTTDPVERSQLRWLAWGAGVMAFAYAMAFVPQAVLGSEAGSRWEDILGTLAVSTFLLIPITIGIAVLRYRLYDIDFVIRKTVVFAVMATSIAIVYATVVAGVGAVVGAERSPVLSAIAAAIVALVFQPARARARHLADRLVYGERATPYEVMSTFGGQLAGTYASEDVLPRTARVLGEGVGAERAQVRLAEGNELRTVATWPTDAPARDDDLVVEVRHQGEVLGALAVSMPANDPIDPNREQLVRDLAAQAGLVLRNERLARQLRGRLDQLQAAQKRLVAAQDGERRRLERNIHDGAQQQLVALAVKARLARSLTERDPAKAAAMLEQIEAETHDALEDLRDLARGIYPPLLADKGLEAALVAQARKSPVPVDVQVEGIDRLPQDIEAAVYFSALEALQNTAKYANASRATVTLRRANGSLSFSVVDDGVGFDRDGTGYGTGLQGMADRLGALDGELEVTSRPGSGTTVTGRVPVGAASHGDDGEGKA